MQTIKAKVLVDTDRKLTVELPPEIQTGEYEVVLVLNSSTAKTESAAEIFDKYKDKQDELNEAFEKWVKEVEELPIAPNPTVESDYQHHIVEKYRKQGLEI